METKVPLILLAVISSTILLLSGCQKKNGATSPNSESKSELHGSTKPLQAADLVGYNGTILRKTADRIKQTNDKRNQDIEKTVESGPEQ